MNIVITGRGRRALQRFFPRACRDGHKIALLDLNLEAAEARGGGYLQGGR